MGVGQELPSKLTLAASRYAARRCLGKGASGTVWLCDDPDSGTPIALKLGREPTEVSRLADEAERLVLAEPANMPRLLDAGLVDAALDDGPRRRLPYIALELIDGVPLEEAARGGSGASPRDRALVAARDVSRALADLHVSGLSHGDLKPGNVLWRKSGAEGPRATLVDLGLAGAADVRAIGGGTPRYLAPEAFTSDGSDARFRDLWALGLLIAETAAPGLLDETRPAEALARANLPDDLRAMVDALLSRSAWARPSAAWVHRTACRLLSEDPTDSIERRRSAILRAFRAAHRSALLQAARGRPWLVDAAGLPGDWLRSTLKRLDGVARLRGRARDGAAVTLGELDPLRRAAWIQAVVEAPIADWPLDDTLTDATVAEGLLAAAEHHDLRSLTFSELVGQPQEASATPTEPLVLALRLGDARVADPVLEAAEAWVRGGTAPAEATLTVGSALRRRGDTGRALALLCGVGTAPALAEAAEAARRSGAGDRARDLVAAAQAANPSRTTRSRLRGLEGRLLLDAGEPAQAIACLDDRPLSAAESETRALVELALGNRKEADRRARAGLVLARTDEERARLEAVVGNVAHATGDAARALRAFRRAVDHATRAGAVLEEATYLTGVAASARDAGVLSEALDAAGRSALLFGYLGRRADAGRAFLARAAAYVAVSATTLAIEAAEEAIFHARAMGDDRCRAYAHIVLADTTATGDRNALEHARRALSLIGDDASDRLHVAARLLTHGDDLDTKAFDVLASGDGPNAEARLEWWGARARRAQGAPEATAILAALGGLASVPAPVPTRGAAMAAGAALAARVGDGEAARRLALPAMEAARLLVEGAPAELRSAARAIPWAVALAAPASGGVSAAQLRDVETLVRALGTRDRLGPLLNQVLDALVLWSGVERGLLLLRAPGDRLVARAARNLAREDLSGTQLELSHTLARRALATGEPVVAVDASGELSEVHESVHALRLRSVLAIPLIARGDALGVVYLDDRVRRGAFGPDERSWARLVAAIAAVAIADARDQLLLRRAARRARRAEARLARELATREAELSVAQSELARSRDSRGTRFEYGNIVGHSEPMRKTLQLIDRVAASEVPVLITGESGSGKELVARAIHDHGPRKAERFVTENCGAIPEGLLESTLFGHVRGAFTGASRPRIGLLQVADGGTLFLDEIGEMSLPMQAKLLRVLEDGEVKPVGSERAKHVSVRVITATHRDLDKMVQRGAFRQDLYYRLDVISVQVPPLRDRAGDIEILAQHFIDKHADRPVQISRVAMDALSSHPWPGNVRQLENEIRRALVMADGIIGLEHLSADVRSAGRGGTGAAAALDLRRRVDALEADLVRQALGKTAGNQTRAAELLGLSRFGLQKMIKRLGIDVTSALDRSAPGG